MIHLLDRKGEGPNRRAIKKSTGRTLHRLSDARPTILRRMEGPFEAELKPGIDFSKIII
jgi:hypothetical protein